MTTELIYSNYALACQWMALALMFLISSIWSERNVKFGYIITPLMGGFFWSIGWIQFSYLGSIIPLVIMMGILAYLRTHLRQKFGVFGSSSGLLFKIASFAIFLQFALILVNGLASAGVFETQFAPSPTNGLTTYSIEQASTVYGQATNVSATDVAWNTIGLVWMQWNVLWQMMFGFFYIYPNLVNIFHCPANLAAIISAGLYLLTAIEIFVLIFKPFRAPEV